MLSNPLPHQPPLLQIPKYIPQYSPHLTRPKLVDPSYFVAYPQSLSPVQPDSPATVEDDIPSPHSPPSGSGNYNYADRNSGAFDSPISPAEMYEPNHGASYPPASHSYQSVPSQTHYDYMSSGHSLRAPHADRSYLSESPSPVDPHSSSSYPQIISATNSHDRPSQYQPGGDRFDGPSNIDHDRYSRNIPAEKYSSDSSTSTLLDHRRMSEPAILAASNPYSVQSGNPDPPHRLQTQFNFNSHAHNQPRPSAYVPALHRGASIGSLRDLRHAHLEYPVEAPYHDNSHRPQLEAYHDHDGLDDPLSPLQPDFSGGVDTSAHGLPYSPTTEHHYGPSPPGTGTSATSSVAPLISPTTASFLHKEDSIPVPMPRDGSSKTYSFVALPGNTVKKRPRRRYDEIERLYQCAWPDCNKAYGTLNHLNAHVTMQKHGQKRSPNEFKELRKQWRKAKKSDDPSQLASPGPMRRGSLSMRADVREYSTRRYDSSGMASSAPSGMSIDSGDRLSYPLEVQGRYQVDDRGDDHLAAYSAHATRQRYTPSSWNESTRATGLHHQYLSASLPSQSLAHSVSLDSGMHQHPRSRSPLASSSNSLPADSTLLTPLRGYQPPLLPPLQTSNMSYSVESGYDLYDDTQDGRSHAAHESSSRASEDDY
ncbi:hypothetical protein H0H81_007211 [Sphagnurus paluster]|uniref:C2H2-type domain-containing protein n=1 Tax=Sphagnurus paluster TaxID=117069 RepID=A0A9P7FTB1_9AGAR|nr:hypothetical protein H0H81_007211 [Sphagnurus paluster]